jgi:hypothetical protein
MTFAHLRFVLSGVFAVALGIHIIFLAGCSTQTKTPRIEKPEADWPAGMQQEIMAAQQEINEYVKAIKTVLQAEDVDRDWSAQAVDQINRAFESKEAGGASIDDIQCRSTRCRIVVKGDPVLVGKVLHRSSPKLSEMFSQSLMTKVRNEEDGISTVIFLVRHGYSLP